jgi:cold shock CspA family protein
MRKGIVQYYLEKKGYGYIRDLETREEFFFKKKHLQSDVRDKVMVYFAVGENKQGLYAYNIRRAS